jgi:hypothetical protein
MMSNNSSSSDLVKDWLRDCKRLTGIVDTSPSSSPQNSNRGEASPATLDAIFRLLDDPKVNPEVSREVGPAAKKCFKIVLPNSYWKESVTNFTLFIGQGM